MIPKDGKKSFEERVAEGRAWVQGKLDKGWQRTPDGILPMTEVKKAGYSLDENNEWVITAEVYIADGNDDRQAGTKYVGPSRQYLDWRKQRKIKDSNRSAKPTENQLKFMKEEEPEPVQDSDDEIRVEDIPF